MKSTINTIRDILNAKTANGKVGWNGHGDDGGSHQWCYIPSSEWEAREELLKGFGCVMVERSTDKEVWSVDGKEFHLNLNTKTLSHYR